MNEFVLVSSISGDVVWSYVSRDALLCRYAGLEPYDEIKEFTEVARVGSFVRINDKHLLFRVSCTK